MPKHPKGKAAGERCAHLEADLRCGLFGQAARPAVCASLRPASSMCGNSREEALAHLHWLERVTQ